MANLQWNEMPLWQQAAIVVAGVLQFGLLGAALLDLSRRTQEQINGRKSVWTAVVFLNFIGPAAYFTRGRRTH